MPLRILEILQYTHRRTYECRWTRILQRDVRDFRFFTVIIDSKQTFTPAWPDLL